MIDFRAMEIKKCFSSCWERFLSCFQKNERTGNNNGREDRPAIVIENSGAVNLKRSLPPVPLDKAGDYYVAQYDYSARTNQDLSFNAGDTLEALDKSPGDWWYARALTGVSANKRGYIPANYVAPLESINAEP